MSTTIDQRVVEMRFDNQHFEKNVSNTMSTLDKLKRGLKFSGASKGLEDINTAAKKVDMGILSNSVSAVGSSFSALQVMAVTALANITNSAVNTGKRIVSALTVEPVMTGFQEYETQINSIQTILANTSHAGTDLNDVNNALDVLNTYADKTIYNFTEMTRNIGTFTAAGVDLDTSVNAIKGIANLAAVSGSTSQQASTAMYQLSQALAAGTVKLQDWNSVVNAGMGGKVFQDALVRTAAVMSGSAKNVEAWRKANIDSHGSFRDSLTEGAWLTTEVLTETLSQFTGDMTDAQLKAKGYTDQQIADIQKMAVTANDAATKVKTFTQLWDTLKEAAQSGWTQTWEIIVGDFEESKSLLTSVSDTINDMIGKSAEARNSLLSDVFSKTDVTSYISDLTGMTEESVAELKKLGETTGYTSDEFKELASTLAEGDDNMQTTITNLLKMSSGEKDVIGYISEMTGMTERSVRELSRLGKKTGYTSDEFQNLAMTLAEGDEAMAMTITNLLKMTNEMDKLSGREVLIESFKNIFEALCRVVKPVKEAFSDIFPAVSANQIYNALLSFKEFTNHLKIGVTTTNDIKRTFKGLFSILDIGRKIIISVAKPFVELLGSDGVSKLGKTLLSATASLGDFFTTMNEGFDTSGITGLLSSMVSGISKFLGIASDKIQSFGDIFSFVGGVISDVAGSIWKALQEVFGWISENVSLSDVFVSLTGGGIFVLAKKLGGFVDKIKETFEGLFGKGDGKKGGFLADIGEKFTEVMDSVHGALESFTIGINAAALLSIATAIGILSVSLKNISTLSVPDITKSLFAIATMLTMLSIGFRSITKSLTTFSPKGIIKAGVALVMVAYSIKILSDAMTEISKLSLVEIGKGLLGIGASLVGLTKAIKVIGSIKIPLHTSVAILALAYSCKILGDALGTFSQLSWNEIARGLASMGGALAELVASVSILGKFGGSNSLFGSLSILIVVQTLEKMAEGLKSFAQMSWDEISRGLTAMGGALYELGAVLSNLGWIAGSSSIFAAGAIWITIQGLDDLARALSKFAKLTWGKIAKSLVAMGGALYELGAVLNSVGWIAGGSSIFAAGAIWIVTQGLSDLAESLKKFSELSWGEIARGLISMGGALYEVGAVTGALGFIAGFSGIFGAGAIWVTIQGLSDLAESLKKFGEMSWDAIDRGLSAMGLALLEVSLFSGALGIIAGFAGILGAASILTTIQGLDDLAESLKKFGEMGWDEIRKGISAMGLALTELAAGGFLNTFAIIGSYSIKNVAEPLGVLADSVKKWVDVKVPVGLGLELTSLAGGIVSFTHAFLGSFSISTVAEPLGVLADSVKKWTGVTVPDGLESNLTSLANGIKAFSWAFMGGWSISAAAEPLGTLATSVSKWRNVSVPDDIESKLTALANGVKAFSWAFMGGYSISTIVEPLGTLVDSVKKWNGVRLPEDIETKLTSLANGVKAFSWAFMGGFSIGTITEPLANLAESVKKWNRVVIPENLGVDLESLADGVKSFTWALIGSQSIETVAGPLGTLADSIKKLSGIVFPEDIGVKLTSVADGIKSFGGISDLINSSVVISSIISSVQKFNGLNYEFISSGIRKFADSLVGLGRTNIVEIANAFSNAAPQLTSAISNMMSSIAKSITSKKTTVMQSFTTVFTDSLATINSKKTLFNTAGQDTMKHLVAGIKSVNPEVNTAFVELIESVLIYIKSQFPIFIDIGKKLILKMIDGIKANTKALKKTFTDLLDTTVDTIKMGYSSFYKAGAYLVDGFAAGISSNAFKAEAQAKAMADAAVAAAQAALGIQSPSRVFRDEVGAMLPAGMAEGITAYSYKAASASADMATKVTAAATDAFDKAAFEKEINKIIGDGVTKGILKSSKKATTAAKKAAKATTAAWVEEQKKNSDFGLVEELAAWKRVQESYKEGSEERNKAVDEVKRVRKELTDANEEYYNNVVNTQKEATDKRKQLDEEYYYKSKELNEKLNDDIWELENAYEDALMSRSESLYNSYSLFDKVKKEDDVSGDQLMRNLQGQLIAFEEWTTNINSLADRGLNTDLLAELREMGVSAIAEIKALNNLTDQQLDQYVSVWESKHRLAMEQAFFELDDMREETGKKVNALREEAAIELEAYKEEWVQNIQALNDETKLKLDDLKTAWMQKVIGLSDDTTSEFSRMAMSITNILGNSSGWSASGANIIQGVLTGVVNNSSKLTSGIENVMNTALTAAKKVLGINSPSKEFAKIGRYSDEGLAIGLRKYAGDVAVAAEDVSKTAVKALTSTIAKISAAVDEGLDSQPTIRPILDLSDIESGTAGLNALFSRNQAMSISAGMIRNRNEEIQNGDSNTPKSGNVYTFTQNNYSPKALSRLEIYRQTKNQFSAMKGLVES